MAFYDRLMSIDRRIIFLSIGLAVALPLIWPLGFPVEVSEETRSFHREIEALKPGDVILLQLRLRGRRDGRGRPDGGRRDEPRLHART